MVRIIQKIKKWYAGEFILPDPNKSSLAYRGHYKQPFAAKVLKFIGVFWLKHWFKILSLAIALSASIALWSKI